MAESMGSIVDASIKDDVESGEMRSGFAGSGNSEKYCNTVFKDMR